MSDEYKNKEHCCGNCFYWRPFTTNRGDCRFSTPHIVLATDDPREDPDLYAGDLYAGQWPSTYGADWCGKHITPGEKDINKLIHWMNIKRLMSSVSPGELVIEKLMDLVKEEFGAK